MQGTICGPNKNKFSTRWNKHRSNWNQAKFDNGDDGTAALFNHYINKHKSNTELILSQCYTVSFVEQPPYNKLDLAEDKWFNQIGATINVKKMITPRYK